MQGIAYIKDNKPYITWPAIHVMLDDDGNPTGEVTSNLEELVADLPKGTDYILVAEEEAEAWWQANKPEPTVFEKIAEAQAPFLEQQTLAKSDFVTARIEGDAEFESEAQANYQASIDAMKQATSEVTGG